MQRQAALAVASRLEDWPEWISAAWVAGYWACDGELDPAPLLERAWITGRSVYLPVLDRACALHFAPYSTERRCAAIASISLNQQSRQKHGWNPPD